MRILRPALCAGIAAIALGCGSPSQRGQEVLQDRLLADPSDRDARLDLVRLRLAEGLVGEAIAELALLNERGWLHKSDKAIFVRLLRLRASERLALGDAEALSDWKASGTTPGPEYYALAAVASLRHSSRFEKARARDYLMALPASDPRSQFGQELGLSEPGRLEVFHWLRQAGAKREALRVAQIYVDGGGRDRAILQMWRDLHQWWFGSSRPALPSEAASLARDAPSALVSLLGVIVVASEASAASLASDWGAPEWGDEMASIQRAFAADPALAERLSRGFIDRAVYGARERAIIVELFYRLGDFPRARNFAVELAGLSTRMPVFDQVAGLASAAAGDAEAANLYFTRAAAASGDPGAYWAMAARAYRGLGAYLPALAACRKALALTARGQDAAILLDLAFSQRALGREQDALTSEEVLLESAGPVDRARVQELLELDRNRGRLLSLLDPLRAQLGY